MARPGPQYLPHSCDCRGPRGPALRSGTTAAGCSTACGQLAEVGDRRGPAVYAAPIYRQAG